MRKIVLMIMGIVLATMPLSAQDIGLANICHDTFDASHNGSLQLNFEVNF